MAAVRRPSRRADARRTFVTGRADFIARLDESCVDAGRLHGKLAVLCVDLDRFKHINAAFGHEFGDAVLRAVAIRLRTTVDGTVVLAHLAGDEFALVLPVADAGEALAAAQRVRNLLGAPLNLGEGPTVSISGSVGVSIFPDHGIAAAVLLNRADIAVYRAKEGPEDNCQLYSEAMEDAPRERQQMLVALHEAIEKGQFTLAFQPKFTLTDRRYAGAEVLVRWISPSLGDMPPSRFVPVAEDAGLIQGIGDWVLAETARFLARSNEAGSAVGPLAVNISAAQLRREDFAAGFTALLALTDCGSANQLELEITESALMENIETAAHRLGAARRLGLSITLDDFGTGYSAFSHLKHLPIGALKIAPDFIQDVIDDAASRRLVAAMIAMGKALGLRVVAEGVETEAQAAFLAAQGCDVGQGFLYARPMAEAEFVAWLATCAR
jgi:diguanylate cyclase (GGDEF)-like protein